MIFLCTRTIKDFYYVLPASNDILKTLREREGGLGMRDGFRFITIIRSIFARVVLLSSTECKCGIGCQ